MRFRSSEAASATGGRMHGPDLWIEGRLVRLTRTTARVARADRRRPRRTRPRRRRVLGRRRGLAHQPTGRSLGLSASPTMIEVEDTGAALMTLEAHVDRENVRAAIERDERWSARGAG